MQNTKRLGRLHIKGSITYRMLAIYSICLYIILATVFEATQVSFTFIASIAIYFSLACCALYAFSTGKIRLNWFVWGLFAFGVILAISCLYTPGWSYASSRLYRYWTSLVLVVLACNAIEDRSDITKLIYSFIIGGVGISLYVYGYYGLDFLVQMGGRLQNGDFGNVNSLGLNCALSIVLAVYQLVCFKKQTRKRNRFFLISVIVVCTPILMFSGSRKALLTLIVSLITFVLFYSKSKSIAKRLLLIVAIVFTAVLLLNIVPAFSPIKDRFVELFESAEDGALAEGDRIYFIQKGMESFRKSIFFGNGFCYSYYLFGTYSHNNYVELLMNNGIIGFVAYYWIYLKLAFDSYKLKKHKEVFALVGMMLAQLLFKEIGVVDHYTRMNLLMLGILYSSIYTTQKQEHRNIEENISDIDVKA